MSAPLLRTKLFVPPLRAEFVSRPVLVGRLDEGLRRGSRLILISAPAGFGKTTLLSEWAAGIGRPVAWLSLDSGDNDRARFFSYLLAALQGVDPGIGQIAQAMLQAPQPPAPEPLLTAVINDVAQASQPLILVLDDYHLIEARPIHDALAFLLERAPPRMHVVLATRADPLLPVARLRGRGQLTELYQADLRFTAGETADFLNRVMGLDLTAGDVAALGRRTEGWIAGLQMAAVSARGRDDIEGFVRAFAGSHRYVLDYLAGEVLRQQPDAIRGFLLQTAILDRLTAPLSDAVIEAEVLVEEPGGSQAMLRHMDANNLFIVPLDDERRWYRYHRLFADVLLQHLQRERPDLVPELHRRASAWHEHNGLQSEAVSHALAAEDVERAACLIEQAGWSTLERGEMTTLLGWLDTLPDGIERRRPRLGILRAWALAFTARWDDIEPCLAAIDGEGIAGEVAAVRAHVAAYRGDVEQAVALAHQALEHLPEEDLFLRGTVAFILGFTIMMMTGKPAASSQAYADAAKMGRASGNAYLEVAATCTLGDVQAMEGQLHLAEDTFARAIRVARAGPGPPTLFVGRAHLGMAALLYEWNDLDGAARLAREGIELGERAASVDVLRGGWGYIALARIHRARGHIGRALQVVDQAERFARQCDLARQMAMIAAFRAQLWLAQGNLAGASGWAQASRVAATDEVDRRREFEHTTLARVLVAQGRLDEALGLLTRLLEAGENEGRMHRAIKILALKALVLEAGGDAERALASLERALSLAAPERYVRTFVDEGEPMGSLLRRALARGIAPDYVSRLLLACDGAAEMAPSAIDSLVEPLTGRELEVLRLIVAGLSNPEIAEELFVAVSTVKSHVNHIYGKLGVNNRVEAVTRAQGLGLL